ncbi:Hypothetical predicted protein [Paramuricea clavata]|uniref:Band 7 domain-containing protein n=1 Tax=Paramuricea clavata TaxID=317549 RepID=A0A6S7J6L0_PARCT|nr:Hypothetical predicted protein [Paramuricea clavata]
MVGFETCGPNEAIVVSGMCTGRGPKYVSGGRLFVLPFVQKAQRLNLNTMTLSVDSPRVYTVEGVPISVTGIAQVKIRGENVDMLKAAAEQFLDKSISEIQQIALETLVSFVCFW